MTCFLVSIVPNWKFEFHMHIDVSNFVLAVMLGQNLGNMIFCPIYYASQLMNNIKRNYTTIKRKL
jgi:hypothetical protein